MIFKNVAGQGVYLTAIDSTDGSAKTGDAPNITGQYSLDGGADAACAGTVVEIARGKYWLPLARAETNGAAFAYDGTSTTADVVIEPVIGFTVPAGANLAEFKADVSNLDAAVSSRSTFDPATDTVARVTLVDTTTTNTDMRGTDGAMLPGSSVDVASVDGVPVDINNFPTVINIDDQLTTTKGAGPWGAVGATGANIVNVTIEDTLGNVMPQTSVVIRNTADTITLGFYVTNLDGRITANLDNGTYRVRVGKVGYMFTIPETLIVLGDTNQTYVGTKVDPSVPVAGLQALAGNIMLLTGEYEAQASVKAEIASMPQSVDVSVLSGQVVTTPTDGNGNFALYLIKGAAVRVSIVQTETGKKFWSKFFTVTNDDNRNITEY